MNATVNCKKFNTRDEIVFVVKYKYKVYDAKNNYPYSIKKSMEQRKSLGIVDA